MKDSVPPADGAGKRRERGRPRSAERVAADELTAQLNEAYPAAEVFLDENVSMLATLAAQEAIHGIWNDDPSDDADVLGVRRAIRDIVANYFLGSGGARGVVNPDMPEEKSLVLRTLGDVIAKKRGVEHPSGFAYFGFPEVPQRREGDTRTTLVPGGHRTGLREQAEFIAALHVRDFIRNTSLIADFDRFVRAWRFDLAIASMDMIAGNVNADSRLRGVAGRIRGELEKIKETFRVELEVIQNVWQPAGASTTTRLFRAKLSFAVYLDSRRAIGCRLDVPHLRLCRVPDCTKPLFAWRADSEGKRGLPKPPDYCDRHSETGESGINPDAERQRRCRAKQPRKPRKRNRGT